MTPKTKAKLLIAKHYNEIGFYPQAKACAIVTVDEIITTGLLAEGSPYHQFWIEVKKEIETP